MPKLKGLLVARLKVCKSIKPNVMVIEAIEFTAAANHAAEIEAIHKRVAGEVEVEVQVYIEPPSRPSKDFKVREAGTRFP